jgi:N,N'-diacetyllegionaminate synthase
MDRTLVIAEIGVNHNGDIRLAKAMIEAARDCGADIVKFQTYKAEEVMTEHTPLAGYMQGEDANFLEMARRLELSGSKTAELKAFSDRLGIEFLSSPFDAASCDFLGSLGMKRLKIPSGESVNPFVLKAAARTQLPLVVSTGMADLGEVGRTLACLRAYGSGPITLLHCTTQYPADPKFANLRAMNTMREAFNLPVGYSDHSPGIEVSLAATALGAVLIEKHFTLDRSLPGPDQAASLEPDQLKALVEGVHTINQSLGSGEKTPWPVELEIAKVARKSLVLRKALGKGEVLEEQHLTAKRPGTGIPAIELERVIGRRLARDVSENELLHWPDLD